MPSGACLLCYLWPKWFKVPAREWESRNSPSCACARGSPRFSCLEAVFLGGERNFCNIHFSSLFCLRRGNGFPLSLSGRFSRPPKSINKDRVRKEGRARELGSRQRLTVPEQRGRDENPSRDRFIPNSILRERIIVSVKFVAAVFLQ